MQETLLSTKLFPPIPRDNHITRSGLITSLSQALTKRLTLISAPPGYGKTSLVSSFLQGVTLPYSWLSLDEGDNDPVRFLVYFLAALGKVIPSLRPDIIDLFQSNRGNPFEALITHLINEASTVGNFILVIDDFHIIHTNLLLDMMTYLIDHMPPTMHLILLTREDPPLPLSRLRARGELLEIRAGELHFTAEEICRLYESLGLSLSEAEVSAMETKTEGWIAGLQLAALAMQGRTSRGPADAEAFISAFSGSHTYILDYLTEEVLNLQSEPVRRFLLQSSILDRMSAVQCEAIVQTGQDEPIDGQAILETLDRDNLFIIPLDGERRWYRYHHLFRDMLQRRLEISDPQSIPTLHFRASEWYEQNNDPREAIHHAIQSGDSEQLTRLVEQYGCNLLIDGEVINLSRWLLSIDPYIRKRPWLAMQKAWVLLLTGHPEEVEEIITTGEQLVSAFASGGEARTMLGSFASARALLANLQSRSDLAADYAQHALDYLDDNNDFSCSLRGVATSLLGDASWMNGELERARSAYTDAVAIARRANNLHTQIMSQTSLGDIALEQAHYHEADRVYQETLELANRADGPNSPYASYILFGLSRVAYARNHLVQAMEFIERCSQLCTQWNTPNVKTACQVLKAQLESASGHDQAAQSLFHSAEEQAHQSPLSPHWMMWVMPAIARFWLDWEESGPALEYLQTSGIITGYSDLNDISLPEFSLDEPVVYRYLPAYLILVRLLLFQGNLDSALSVCDHLINHAEDREQTERSVELFILQALLYHGKNDTLKSLAALEQALNIALPEHASRFFLDEGQPMASLLLQAKSHRVGGKFVTEMLASLIQQAQATDANLGSPQKLTRTGEENRGQNLLVEPLSNREIEILKSIADGLSNQEIADLFVISPKTVKRHISNIYGKLDAKNRTQAIALARDLKILP